MPRSQICATTDERDLYAAIEAGGTQFKVGVGRADGVIIEHTHFATGTPSETINSAVDWLVQAKRTYGEFSAIGIGCFGPISTDVDSLEWGRLGPTPKLEWRGFNIAEAFKILGIPIAIDTDVNAAALAEWRWGARTGSGSLCYVTVGTGIGGGAVVDGQILGGPGHPEMGHMYVRRRPEDDFPGVCPIHSDCLEGLASGTAIRARWRASLSELGPTHDAHGLIAYYLAQACINIFAVLAPRTIVLGGGVMAAPGLLERVQQQVVSLANGYFVHVDGKSVLPAALAPLSGLKGAIALANAALASYPGRAR